MKKLSLYIFLVLMICNVGNANPMWKISDDWICKPKLHTKIKLDGTVIGINEIAITHTIDFKNSKIVSTSGNQIGKIIDTRHTVTGLSQTSQGVVPLEGGFRYVLKETKYIRYSDDPGNTSYVLYAGWRGNYSFWWKGEEVGTSETGRVLQYDETTQFRGGTMEVRGWRYSIRQIERYTLEPGPANPVATFNDIELTGGETDLGGFKKAKVQIKLYDNNVASWTVTDGGGPYRKGTKLSIPSVSGGGKTFSGLSNVVPVLGLYDEYKPFEVLNDDGDQTVTDIISAWPYRPYPDWNEDGSAPLNGRNLRPLDAIP